MEAVGKRQVGLFSQFFKNKALWTLLSHQEVGGSLTLVLTVTTTPPFSLLSVVLTLPRVVPYKVMTCGFQLLFRLKSLRAEDLPLADL